MLQANVVILTEGESCLEEIRGNMLSLVLKQVVEDVTVKHLMHVEKSFTAYGLYVIMRRLYEAMQISEMQCYARLCLSQEGEMA